VDGLAVLGGTTGARVFRKGRPPAEKRAGERLFEG
jgi:hypothetical protein